MNDIFSIPFIDIQWSDRPIINTRIRHILEASGYTRLREIVAQWEADPSHFLRIPSLGRFCFNAIRTTLECHSILPIKDELVTAKADLSILDIPISAIHWDVSHFAIQLFLNCLTSYGCKTLGDVADAWPMIGNGTQKVRGFGDKSRKAVRKSLEWYRLMPVPAKSPLNASMTKAPRTADKPLKLGAFYWALPVLDPDTDADWENKEQPARFNGYDAAGNESWHWLGVEGDMPGKASRWPSRWVGSEIEP